MKKVNTYGRKKTQIISVHADISPIRAPTTTSHPPVLTPPAKRQPLFAKPSSENHATPTKAPLSSAEIDKEKQKKEATAEEEGPIMKERAKGKAKANARANSQSTTPEVIAPRRARPGRAIVPRLAPDSRLGSSSASPIKAPSEVPKARRPAVEVVMEPRKGSRPPADIPPERLLQRFERLSVDDSPSCPAQSGSTSLPDLLSVCSSSRAHPFSGFLTASTFLSQAFRALAPPKIRKVGEASYSEVFGVKLAGKPEVVVKIIPLLTTAVIGEEGLPDCSELADVKREIEMTKWVGDMAGDGFIKLLGAFVVKGKYPADLLEEWDRYKRTEGSASCRPDGFSADQLYALMILPNGGTDLEAFSFTPICPWLEVLTILRQTTEALALAEKALHFEHRDLHEGQILISRCPVDLTGDKPSLSPDELKVTIIDLGLSRLATPEGMVLYTTPPKEVFDGKGDQWDIYRAMRDESEERWEGYNPRSNAMWLAYLLRYMLHNKEIRKPRPAASSASIRSSPLKPARRVPTAHSTPARLKATASPREELNREAYQALIVLERMLDVGGLGPASGAASKGKKGRASDALGSAADVLALFKTLMGRL